jgi:3-hydroxybutyryl-CoA dehydrogenase
MDVTAVNNISVFGAGLMGSGISQIFARQGYRVTAYDIEADQENAMRNRIRSNLNLMLADQSDKDELIEQTNARIRFTTDFKSAAASADFVVECVPENMELKQKLFLRLDDICGSEVPLSSNTSVMSPTEIGSRCQGKHRILGTHFWNPPFLLPLVEVVRTVDTADTIVDLTMALLKKIGKHPILVKRDVPGFVANRLQHALWREAISIVENDIADAQTVDEAIKYSFGMRLPVLAPLENADLVGTDLVHSIHTYVLPHLENSPSPSPYLKQLVENGKLGFKSGEGFMKWTTDEQRALQEKMIKYLVKSISPDG